MKSIETRSAQRDSSESVEHEVCALETLTKANNPSTPTLLASKIIEQGATMWVSGGYLGYIAMTKLPGARVDRIEDLDLQERKQMRKSFKRAWKSVILFIFIDIDIYHDLFILTSS